jgi:uncharacterized protein
MRRKKMAAAEKQISRQIDSALQNMMDAVPELRGTIVADSEGLPVAQILPSGLDALRAAAIAATAQGLGKRTVEMLKSGVLTEVSVAGTEGLTFLYTAGSRFVLVVLAPNDTNVGLIHLSARDCAKKIAMMIG